MLRGVPVTEEASMLSEEFQNLMRQIPKLTPIERVRLLEVLRTAAVEPPPTQPMTEEDFLDYMQRIGKLTRSRRTSPWPDFDLVQISGQPLSEDIIEGRGPR